MSAHLRRAAARSGDQEPGPAGSADFIERFLGGQPDTVRAVSDWARAVAVHRAWGFDSPEDIVQAVLLAVVGNLRAGRYEPGDLRAYVRRIAKNLCVTSYRKARLWRDRMPLEVAEEVLVSTGAAQPERRSVLEGILRRLDAACRETITLAYLYGLNRRELALRYGISEGAAKVRLFRCMEKARALQPEVTDPCALLRDPEIRDCHAG